MSAATELANLLPESGEDEITVEQMVRFLLDYADGITPRCDVCDAPLIADYPGCPSYSLDAEPWCQDYRHHERCCGGCRECAEQDAREMGL